jgi:hypothetical protein
MSGLWYVKLPDGDVEPVTLDELDEAFQAGHINENTMVLADGETQWARLGDLAGLDQPAQRPAPQRPAQYDYAAPAPYRAPMPVLPAAYPPPMPRSLRPVSVDLGEFDDDISFQTPKKSKKWMVGVVLVGVLGFAGFEAQRSGVVSISRLMAYTSSAAAVATAPVVAPPPPAAAPAPAPAPSPAPSAATSAGATTAATTAPAASDTSASRFTQEQKDKLAAADKMRDAKAKLHAKARAAAVTTMHTSSHSKAQGFTTDGNKFDPLNATIP